MCAVCVNVGMCACERGGGGRSARFGSRASLVRVSESASVCQST